MKIEMGESLILSWLRHTKHCQSVQLNWKPSTSSWELHNKEKIEQLMRVVSESYHINHQMTIFKNNQSYSQLLQQGEIDVLGLEIQNAKVAEIYGIDIAFHEGGLNYGGTQGTVERVIKKLVRTAMIILGYFNLDRGKIIFASPKIPYASSELFVTSINKLNTIVKDLNLDFEFIVYGNEDFKENIFLPVISLSRSVADTSELFMRSLQMYNMFMDDTSVTPRSQTIQPPKKIKPSTTSNTNETDEIKIGVFVRTSIANLITNDQLTAEMLEWLSSKKYCKETFDINYPLLKKLESSVPLAEQRKINSYDRYWKEVLTINGEKYLLCNDWYDRNRVKFQTWLENITPSNMKLKKKKKTPFSFFK